jgi:hypothetical protein
MDKYSISIRKNMTAAVLAAYENGVLKSLEVVTPGLTKTQVGWLKNTVPADEQELPALTNTYNFISIEKAPTDLSFNAFWELYAYKVGKKDRAIRLWQGLNEAERVKCLRSIPRYKMWLAQKQSIEMLYPETYLAQKRYENEFKI